MNKRLLAGSAILAASAAAASPAAAQAPDLGRPVTAGHGSVYVQPYVGYMKFGELADLGGEREFSNEDGPLYGVQAGYSFSPNVALVGNLGYSKSKFQVKDFGGVGGDQNANVSGDIGFWVYDANLQLKLPFVANRLGGAIAPFAQAGVGQVKYTGDSDDLASNGTTSTAFNVGLGADFQLMKALGLRVMVKDYVTSLDWNKFADVPRELQDGRDNNTANNFAFTVGLNLGF